MKQFVKLRLSSDSLFLCLYSSYYISRNNPWENIMPFNYCNKYYLWGILGNEQKPNLEIPPQWRSPYSCKAFSSGKNDGKSIDDIALYLGRNRSTIYREMNGAGADIYKYYAEIYHNHSRRNMSRNVDKGPSSEIIFLIDQKILYEQWSPEQISNWLKINNYEPVSHT